MDPKREAYPFAGALCVAAGDLLARVHEAAGPPPSGDAEDLDGDRRRLAAAAAAGYGAAAACAALSARLLLIEREAMRDRLPEVGVPARYELGVTTLEATESRVWQATVRAAAAARGELATAAALWAVDGLAEHDGVSAAVTRLVSYVDELLPVLERIEPAEAGL